MNDEDGPVKLYDHISSNSDGEEVAVVSVNHSNKDTIILDHLIELSYRQSVV